MNTNTTASTKFSLHFGDDIQGRDVVDDIAFQGFLADIVTPRFSGFTLIEAKGYWEGNPEETRILEIVVPYTFQDALQTTRETVHKVARAYAIRFKQDAVMVTEENVQFALIEKPKLALQQHDAHEFTARGVRARRATGETPEQRESRLSAFERDLRPVKRNKES